MKLVVKNMVCPRCVAVVRQEAQQMALPYRSVQLGEIVLDEAPNKETIEAFRKALARHGFELLDDRKAMIIEKVKNTIINIVHGADQIDVKRNFSDIISREIGIDYNYISAIFSTTEGTTIEQYIILQRIERAKELLVYNELSLTEISYKLGYTNVQHLSTQFKKVTGLTPSHFKSIGNDKRRSLDRI